MKPGKINKKDRQAELLREKRARAAQAARSLAHAVKTPPKAIHIASASPRASVGRSVAVSEPLPPHSYPVKRVAIGKPQSAGDR